jgi:hypothetical protein
VCVCLWKKRSKSQNFCYLRFQTLNEIINKTEEEENKTGYFCFYFYSFFFWIISYKHALWIGQCFFFQIQNFYCDQIKSLLFVLYSIYFFSKSVWKYTFVSYYLIVLILIVQEVRRIAEFSIKKWLFLFFYFFCFLLNSLNGAHFKKEFKKIQNHKAFNKLINPI